MRYLALATDYDGTLATDGQVSEEAIGAVKRLRASGRRVILVTGRRLVELLEVLPQIDLFDCVVAENGAVLYIPQTREETLLCPPLPLGFIERLRSLGVKPIEVGRVVVATWTPHQNAVLRAIQESGLELLIVFNKNAVMVLPTGVNKATGLSVALRRLGLSFHEAVGIGDGENDQSFLDRCECSAAVANAVPSVVKLVDLVTKGEAGSGLAELVNELIFDDLARMQGNLRRNFIPIGSLEGQGELKVPPYGTNILIAGPSGSGKSTITAGIVERLLEQTYQVCIIDPEGDYGPSRDVIHLGDSNRAISINEVLSILEDPKMNVSLNLLGIQLADRPGFFGQLFPSLRTLRTRTGRPHWMIFDEAHHLLPLDWGHLPEVLPQKLGETILVTVRPDHLPTALLAMMDVVIAVGPSPEATMKSFSTATGRPLLWPQGLSHKAGQAIVWLPASGKPPSPMGIMPPKVDRIRHRRKYAEGNMRYHSFYFRGPGNRHNLKAHNLAIFSQIAEGIDEETWLFHLHRQDYSKWFREAVKDPYMADQAARIELQFPRNSQESRKLIRALIDSRYTLPE
ncbi:HAD family hydrolase [Terriglobus albidus]|uniref:HAD family hydrolase n=1 Tax=Terriglobus albidus TaxID=1592106 RepID=UPI0021DFC5F9|nr:HAD family hydrolase [Terriglobus albidus]